METRYDRGTKSFLILNSEGNPTGDSVKYRFLDEYKGNKHEDEPLTDFTFSIYYRKDVKESDYRTLYLYDTTKDDNKRIIGMMIPFSSLTTEDEEIVKDKNLSCYAFHAYQYILKQTEFEDVYDYESMGEVISQKFENTCLCIFHNPSCSLDIQKKLEISLTKYGFYKYIKDYVNAKIDKDAKLVLYPCDGVLNADGSFYDQYFIDCIRTHLNEKDPILKFLYLYQIIESFFTRIVVQDLEALIAEAKSPAGSLKDFSESLKIKKEINRWQVIEDRAHMSGAGYDVLDTKCCEFLGITDNKLTHPKSIYAVRNHIIHRFRVAVSQIELLKEINFFFELYLIDVLCHYKEDIKNS